MLVENSRNIVPGQRPHAQFPALADCVLQAGAHPGTDHRKFNFRKYPSHLQEGLGHRVNLPVAAVHRDAAHDDQAKTLLPDKVNQLAQLFCGPAQPAYFKGDDCIASGSSFKQTGQIPFYLAVSMFIIQIDFLCSGRLEFSLICCTWHTREDTRQTNALLMLNS